MHVVVWVVNVVSEGRTLLIPKVVGKNPSEARRDIRICLAVAPYGKEGTS